MTPLANATPPPPAAAAAPAPAERTPEEILLDHVIARTGEILERLRVRTLAAVEDARVQIALAAAAIRRRDDRRAVVADAEFAAQVEREARAEVDEALAAARLQDAAMNDIHGGHPDDPDYLST